MTSGLRNWFAPYLSSELKALSGLALADAVGTGMFLSGGLVFFIKVHGLTPSQFGIGLSVSLIAGTLCAAPAGRLGDRVGHRAVLVALNLIMLACFLTFSVSVSWPLFLVTMAVIGGSQAGSIPGRRALLSSLSAPRDLVSNSARMRVLTNLGFAVGAGLAALALLPGTAGWARLIMIGNTLSFAAAAIFAARMRLPVRVIVPEEDKSRTASRPGSPWKDGRFIALSLVNGLISIHESILAVGLPLVLVLHDGVPNWAVPGVLLLNTVLTVLFQVALSRGADTVPGGVRAMKYAGFGLAFACAVLIPTGSVGTTAAIALVLVATVALTAGELLSAAGAWSLSFALARGPREAEYLGVFTSAHQGMSVIGPLLAVWVAQTGGLVWGMLSVAFLALGVATAAVVPERWAARALVLEREA